jgi:hypothetical protein
MKCKVRVATAVKIYRKPPKPKQFAKLFKMRTASEAFEVNTLLRTNILTSATSGTLRIINYSKIILNLDCTVRTGLLTLHTANTAVRTSLVGYSTLIVAGTLNNNSGLFANNVNNVVRTGLFAKTTADTLGRIYVSNTILRVDLDSILRTNCDTVAVAKTSIGTNGITCVRKLCSLTGLDAVVNVLSVLRLAMTVTSNECNLSINVTCSKAHDLTDLSSNVCAAGDTEAGVVTLALTESLSVTVTTGVTASTAVSTGKAITNSNNLLIFLNCKEACSKGKNNSTNKSNQRKNA